MRRCSHRASVAQAPRAPRSARAATRSAKRVGRERHLDRVVLVGADQGVGERPPGRGGPPGPRRPLRGERMRLQVVRRARRSVRRAARASSRRRPAAPRSPRRRARAAGRRARSAWACGHLDVVGVEQHGGPPHPVGEHRADEHSATAACSRGGDRQVDPGVEGAAPGGPKVSSTTESCGMEARARAGTTATRSVGVRATKVEGSGVAARLDGVVMRITLGSGDATAQRRARACAQPGGDGRLWTRAGRRPRRAVGAPWHDRRCAPSRRSCTSTSTRSSPRSSSATSPRCAASRSSSAASAAAAWWRPRRTRPARSGCTRRCPTAEARRRCPNAAFLVGPVPRLPRHQPRGDGAAALDQPAGRAAVARRGVRRPRRRRPARPLGRPRSAPSAASSRSGSTRSPAASPGRSASAPPSSSPRSPATSTSPTASSSSRPGMEQDLLRPMQVTVIPGVGPATAERLRRIGVHTVEELERAHRGRAGPACSAGRTAPASTPWPAPRTTGRWSRSARRSRSASRTPTTPTTSTSGCSRRCSTARRPRSPSGCARPGSSGRTVSIKVRLHDFSTRQPLGDPARALRRRPADRPGRPHAAGRAGHLRRRTPARGRGLRARRLDPGRPLRRRGGRAEAVPDEATEAAVAGRLTAAAAGRPGMDVVHDEHGRGWVWGSGRGVVTVRFETARDRPGPGAQLRGRRPRAARRSAPPEE